ncbi:MAG: BamA/TamA family outer membrane protein [Acidobacteria bacterium]|nr:BamA/TamA family outer membrane protein [Acidobacteriota bacterium]
MRIRRILPLALALAVLGGDSFDAAAAQGGPDALIGQTVVEVRFASDGRELDDPALRDLTETRIGQPLSMREVRETLTHLFGLGRYGGAEVAASALGGGVALLYELQPVEVVERIAFAGSRVLDDGEIRLAVTRIHGAAFVSNQTSAVVETVRALYAERGFLAPRITPELLGRGDRRTLRLTIDAGPPARVRRWSITGPLAFHDTVRARLGLVDGVLYDGVALDAELADYEADLRGQGYYEARLSHDIEPLGEAELDVLLFARRGPRIIVTFTGDEVPGADVADLAPFAREASADEDLVEDAEQRIAAHLRGLGYRDAVVTNTRDGNADALSIAFDVARGPLYRVGQVEIRGNQAIPTGEIEAILDLAEGDPLVVRDLDARLAEIEERYARLGYATVRATREDRAAPEAGGNGNGSGAADGLRAATGAGQAPADGSVLQPMAITIVEGVRTVVGSVAFDGAMALPPASLAQVIGAANGDPYYAPQVNADRDALLTRYLNEGFDRVRINVDAAFSDDLTLVDLTYLIAEGAQVLVDHVLIVGNRQVDAETIRREVTLTPGSPLGLDDVAETRRRLNALGMFRRLDIREFSHGRDDRRDVIIEVDEAPGTRIGYGGGFELSQRLRREVRGARSAAVERIEFAPRGSFEVGRRNLWGKNRSIDLFTRVSVRRKNDPVVFAPGESTRTLGFNEYRVLATYREPRALGLAWDIVMSGYVERAIRPGFDLFTRGITAQLTRSTDVSANTTVGYRLGNNDTSNRVLNREDSDIVDRLFPNVRLSSFTASQVRDTRDDPVDPRRGTFVSLETEVAARAIGSEVGFSKSFASGAWYRQLPGVSRLVVAAGARIGLAWGFPRQIDVGGVEAAADVTRSALALPISERFFAGGNTTVRGFALDRLGSPRTEPGGTIDQDGFPQGGNAMLIFNTELRVRVTRAVGLVTFLDTGNVYDRIEHMSLRRVRSGAGFGVRYHSPVGPLGFDIGFKLGERYLFGDHRNPEPEQRWALHFSFGQAF